MNIQNVRSGLYVKMEHFPMVKTYFRAQKCILPAPGDITDGLTALMNVSSN